MYVPGKISDTLRFHIFLRRRLLRALITFLAIARPVAGRAGASIWARGRLGDEKRSQEEDSSFEILPGL